MRYFAKLKNFLIRFSKKGLTPNEIALGVAIGMLIGFFPILGTHTLLAIGMAHFLRLNTLIVLLGTQICNPISFPFLIFMSAEIGNLLINGSLLKITFSKELNYMSHYFWPIMLGSFVLGAAVSGISYFLIIRFLKRRHRHDTP
jgi:hypothetical protein